MLPPRKIYQFLYQTSYGDLYLRFQDASIEETDSFYAMDTWRRVQHMREFIEQHGELRYKSSIRKKKQKLLEAVYRDRQVYNDLMSSRFKTYSSMYSNPASDPAQKWSKRRRVMEGAHLSTVCKEFNIPWPKHLIEEYTYEQLNRCIDRLIFNNYESSKDTQHLNDNMWRAKNGGTLLDKDDLDLLAVVRKQKEEWIIHAEVQGDEILSSIKR